MRAKDVTQLVAAWSNILEGVEKTSLTTEIGELCFEVIGQYVEWIDINLVRILPYCYNLIPFEDCQREFYGAVIYSLE